MAILPLFYLLNPVHRTFQLYSAEAVVGVEVQICGVWREAMVRGDQELGTETFVTLQKQVTISLLKSQQPQGS